MTDLWLLEEFGFFGKIENMELEKIDRIIQLIITIAGEEDDKYDRELGAIHIVKYLYLAGLGIRKK